MNGNGKDIKYIEGLPNTSIEFHDKSLVKIRESSWNNFSAYILLTIIEWEKNDEYSIVLNNYLNILDDINKKKINFIWFQMKRMKICYLLLFT